jgi:epoxyqueuosine reductase
MSIPCEKIKAKAVALGFDLVGICRPEYSPEDHDHLIRWLTGGNNGDMAYLNRNPRQRSDPRLLLPNVKSVISVGLSYYSEPEYDPQKPYLSIYARSKPYQEILTDKLTKLLEHIVSLEPNAVGKIAVDTSPTFDKLWAQKSGLGWRGKNTIAINKELGSFMFLGELFLNLELAPDSAEIDHCGNCRKCLDACPTGALEEAHVLNANKCIAYLTIEYKSEFAKANSIGNHVFGCDICQIVCPYNNNPRKSASLSLSLPFSAKLPDIEKLTEMTESDFNNRFSGTILAKYGFTRYMKNASAVQLNLSGN